MAGVESVNRYSAIELDDDGNIITRKQQKPKEEKSESKSNQSGGAVANNSQKPQGDESRHRVSDRNRRGGRGGNGAGPAEFRGGRGGRGAHRGGYIGDGQKREFDRRGAPQGDRPRGRARKGGVGLGRYGEDSDFGGVRRNRPHRQEFDPTVSGTDAEQVAESAGDATVAATEAGAEATPAEATDATATETTEAVTEITPVEAEEEADTSLTYDEYQAQKKAKAVDEDLKRSIREVSINDKQWKKVAEVSGKKKKTTLTMSGEEIEVEDDESQNEKTAEKSEKKKKVLSLDEFVGHPSANQQQASSRPTEFQGRGGGASRGGSDSRGGGRGGSGGEFRGRGRGRGGASGEFRGRGRGRGGYNRGPQVAIDDKNAFPDLASAAKKN